MNTDLSIALSSDYFYQGKHLEKSNLNELYPVVLWDTKWATPEHAHLRWQRGRRDVGCRPLQGTCDAPSAI